MFKFNLGLSPVALNNLFVRSSNIHNYNTRNKIKLRSAIGRHKFIYKNFRYISVHIWNNITDKIDTGTSLLTFKKQLKVLLFTDEITIIIIIIIIIRFIPHFLRNVLNQECLYHSAT